MNIRQAILKAADHIEANPVEFSFASMVVPSGPGCGTPGCAIGWIAMFSGRKENEVWGNGGFSSVLDVPERTFYGRMNVLDPSLSWSDYATDCARALRLYADKYHPEETTEEFPSIRAELDRIFEAVTC